MGDDEKTGVGESIRLARGSRDQKWLANVMGVHQTTVSKWETENPIPPPQQLTRLERVLELPAGALVALAYGNMPYEVVPAVEHLHEALEQLGIIRDSLSLLERSIRRALQ